MDLLQQLEKETPRGRRKLRLKESNMLELVHTVVFSGGSQVLIKRQTIPSVLRKRNQSRLSTVKIGLIFSSVWRGNGSSEDRVARIAAYLLSPSLPGARIHGC